VQEPASAIVAEGCLCRWGGHCEPARGSQGYERDLGLPCLCTGLARKDYRPMSVVFFTQVGSTRPAAPAGSRETRLTDRPAVPDDPAR